MPFESTFSKRIERLYEAAGTKAEVVNLGVGNWNTVQEVQHFLTKDYQYRPDIVVLNYFVNDAEPTPERRRPPSLLLQYCYSCVFLKGRLDTVLRQLTERQDWADYYLGLYDGGKSKGWLDAKAAIKRLADYCRQQQHQAAHRPSAGAARRAELSLRAGDGAGPSGGAGK